MDPRETERRFPPVVRLKSLGMPYSPAIRNHFGVTNQVGDLHSIEQVLVEQLNEVHVPRAFGLLAASLRHELAQPLTGMQVNAELVKVIASKGDGSTALLLLADKLLRDCERITTLLGALSELFFDRGRTAPIDLLPVLCALVADIKARTDEVHIDLCVEVEESKPRIAMSPVLLESVVDNLVSNAIEAIRDRRVSDGKVTVIVTTVKDQIVIKVSDNGGGIAPSHVAEIFKVGQGSTKAIPSGLGLWLVKTIIDKHQGELRLNNDFGRGAVFSVSLPRA